MTSMAKLCTIVKKVNMGINFYVLRCSKTEYSGNNQFRSSNIAILSSSGTTSEAKMFKFDLKVNMGINFYVLKLTETEYSGHNQFRSSTAPLGVDTHMDL